MNKMNKLTDEIDDMNYLLFQSKYWSHVHIVIIYYYFFFSFMLFVYFGALILKHT